MPVAPRKASNISLRPARQSDYDFAAALYFDSAKPLLTALDRWNESRVVARFGRAFKPEQAHIIRADGDNIGWLQVSQSVDGFHLHQLHLVDRFRNRGIGTSLIQSLLERARRAKRPVALNVMRGNPAISLYRRLGFSVVGEDAEKFKMRWVGTRA
ncbi:MAG TPA: GNAT family N-acetyltransferase [Stellaceae bacterium]|nr:GNAT family N-acetyltransferase [Stellaceae bacterium]